MQNLKIKAQTIFKALSDKGWQIYDIKYLDGYFIFDHGEDSVVHFRIKGCKGWKFAIWWYEDEEQNNALVFDFFGQYEEYTDKFKPSASTFVIERCWYESADGSDNMIDYDVIRICELLEFIHKHPYVARAYDRGYQRDCWEYLTPFQAWRKEAKYFLEYKMVKNAIKRYYEHKYLRLIRKVADELLVDYEIKDENVGGMICYPRWLIKAKGFKGDEVEKGVYNLVNDLEELPPRLRKKVVKFDNKAYKICNFDGDKVQRTTVVIVL